MAVKISRSILWVLFAVVSFVIAALAFLGIIMPHDPTGRLVFGIVWTAVAVSWLGRYFMARRSDRTSRPPE